MLRLTKRYRTNYTGEDVISKRVMEQGSWTTSIERVGNKVINNQLSNKAVIFGNGVQRLSFDADKVINHRSGLLGVDTLQSYGCNAFYRNYTPDFMVVTNRLIAKEMVDCDYVKNKIIYTRVDITLEFPKKFYLIPNDPYADAGATAIYLAAFDGHKRIYLLGFDGQDTPNYNNNIYAGTNGYPDRHTNVLDDKWVTNQLHVFNTYNDVDFVYVSEAGRNTIPESWRYCTNLRQISYSQWITEADL